MISNFKLAQIYTVCSLDHDLSFHRFCLKFMTQTAEVIKFWEFFSGLKTKTKTTSTVTLLLATPWNSTSTFALPVSVVKSDSLLPPAHAVSITARFYKRADFLVNLKVSAKTLVLLLIYNEFHRLASVASSGVVTYRHALSAWFFQLSFLSIEPLGELNLGSDWVFNWSVAEYFHLSFKNQSRIKIRTRVKAVLKLKNSKLEINKNF